MQVLIDLSSRLLAESLAAMLNADGSELKATVFAESLLLEGYRPDVVVFDCYRCSEVAFEHWPDSRFLLLDTFNDQRKAAFFLMSNDIDGIISPQTDFRLFKKALRAVTEGQLWIEQRNIRYILRNSGNLGAPNSVSHLSPKDQKIVSYIVDGMRNREIADRLFLSEQTVKAHVSRIYRKVGVSNRSQLVSLVLQTN